MRASIGGWRLWRRRPTNRDESRYWVGVVFGAALFLSLGLNALVWAVLPEANDRPPQRVELVIPPGTAQRVAAGEAGPSIPASLIFVVGDTLVIRNEDAVDHQIGPFWIPTGTSVSQLLEGATRLTASCTVRPERSIGLEVWPRVSIAQKILLVVLGGVLFGGLASFFLLAYRWGQAESSDSAVSGQVKPVSKLSP